MSMAIRCGVDIIEIDRIRESIESLGQGFRDRIYTEAEIAYCEDRKAARFESYAVRFAAKEAVAKAMGTGFGSKVGWKDIEVRNDGEGRPHVVLSPSAARIAEELFYRDISIRLSHGKTYAVAYVIIETATITTTETGIDPGGGLAEKG